MRLLSDDQIAAIHEASLNVLETGGVRYDHPEVYRKLCEAGAEGDADGVTVRLPRQLIGRCLESAPRNVKIADRLGRCVEVGADGGTVFWTGNALYLARGRERLDIGSEELTRIARVSDALGNVNGVVGTSLAEHPPPVRDIVGFRIIADNTGKHIRPCIFTADGPRAILEMAEVLADGQPLRERPLVSFGYSIVSPCHWTRVALDVFVNTSGLGIPAMVNAEPLAGGTAPVTLAGLLAQANAEALSGIALLQVLEPGRPSVFNLGFAHTLDMRTMVATSGNIHDGIIAAAGAEIACYHGLPSASWLSSDNTVCDAQSTMEKALTGMLHALAGVNIVWGMGQIETELTLSLEQAVIDDEMVAQLLRVQQGLEVNEETIALQAIKEGITSGDFLSLDHTLRHYRELMIPADLTAPRRRDAWLADGGLMLVERARRKVDEILARPAEPAITPDQSARLREIEARWVQRLTG